MIARSSRKKKGLAVEGGGVVEDWYAGNAIISKSSIAKAFICDKSKANCQQTLAKTIVYNCLEGLCCKASSWPAAVRNPGAFNFEIDLLGFDLSECEKGKTFST